MAAGICPACQCELPEGRANPHWCTACGFDLTKPPPKEGWIVGDVDLRTVAKRQRMLIWYVLASIATTWILPGVFGAIHPLLGLLAVVGVFGVWIMILIGVISMLAALRVHILWRVLYIILMFAPCVSIIMLLIANHLATRALKASGLRVGFMGVSDDQVTRFLGFSRCRKCGYSLIGNTSGRCPECGTLRAAD